jgi:hypothetical protein
MLDKGTVKCNTHYFCQIFHRVYFTNQIHDRHQFRVFRLECLALIVVLEYPS